MFYRMMRCGALAVALATSAVLTCGEARGQDHGYAVIAIKNPNNGPISYAVKWGEDGEWRHTTLDGGKYSWHSYPLDVDGRAPAPRIKFDYILGDRKYAPKTYRLGFYFAGCPGYRQAKKYVFRPSDCGCYLDLYRAE